VFQKRTILQHQCAAATSLCLQRPVPSRPHTFLAHIDHGDLATLTLLLVAFIRPSPRQQSLTVAHQPPKLPTQFRGADVDRGHLQWKSRPAGQPRDFPLGDPRPSPMNRNCGVDEKTPPFPREPRIRFSRIFPVIPLPGVSNQGKRRGIVAIHQDLVLMHLVSAICFTFGTGLSFHARDKCHQNIRYQPAKNDPWSAFTWRYDSGIVSGAVPDLESALG
jgi:hypothetical protein